MMPNFWQFSCRTDPAIDFGYEAALRTANTLNPPACETKCPQLLSVGLWASLGVGRRSPRVFVSWALSYALDGYDR